MQDRERTVEQYLRRRVESLGGECVKFIPDYDRGMPDRIVILPHGGLVWCELKRPSGGKLSGAQMVRHEELRRLGQRVEVLWSREDVDRFLGEMIREAD